MWWDKPVVLMWQPTGVNVIGQHGGPGGGGDPKLPGKDFKLPRRFKVIEISSTDQSDGSIQREYDLNYNQPWLTQKQAVAWMLQTLAFWGQEKDDRAWHSAPTYNGLSIFISISLVCYSRLQSGTPILFHSIELQFCTEF